MGNLFNLRCPNCGRMDRIDVLASVWLRFTEDGTDADMAGNGHHEYGPDSPAHCTACHYEGTIATFPVRGGA